MFKPGQSGNPGGRARQPEEIKAIIRARASEIVVEIDNALSLTNEQRREAIKDPGVNGLRAAVCKVLENVVSKGDHKALDFLFDRLVGKTKEQDPEDDPSEEGSNAAKRSPEEMKALVAAAQKGKDEKAT